MTLAEAITAVETGNAVHVSLVDFDNQMCHEVSRGKVESRPATDEDIRFALDEMAYWDEVNRVRDERR